MRATIIGVFTVVIGLACGSRVQAQSAVKLTPNTGNPGVAVSVAGTKFAVREAVDIYVDTTDTALVVSSATGAVAMTITLPASISPGAHYVTAIGRHSGDAASASFKVSTDWSQYGFSDARTGFNPFENTLTTGNVPALGVLWHKPLTGNGSTPAIVAGRAYFTSSLSGITAVSATTGAALWSKDGPQTMYGSPTVANNVVYVGSLGTKILYALNATTGAPVWSKALPCYVYSSVVVSGNLVYFGCDNDYVYALKVSNGAVAWKYATGGVIDASPAVANGTVYIGSNDDKFYALNALTGALEWSYTTGNPIESSAAVSNGAVYFGSDDNKVYALRIANGTLLWSVATGAQVYSQVTVAQGTVYAGSADGSLYALNAHSGVQRWSAILGNIVSGAAIADGVVYVTSRSGGGTLFAVNASTGAVIWTAEAGYAYLGTPSVANGVVYLNGYNGDAYAYALGKSNDMLRNAHSPARSQLHPNMALSVTQ